LGLDEDACVHRRERSCAPSGRPRRRVLSRREPARGDLLGDGDGVARVERSMPRRCASRCTGSSRQRAWSSQVANVTMATLSPSGALKDLKSTNPGIADARASMAAARGPYSPRHRGARREQKTVTTLFRAGSPLPATSHFRMRGRTSGERRQARERCLTRRSYQDLPLVPLPFRRRSQRLATFAVTQSWCVVHRPVTNAAREAGERWARSSQKVCRRCQRSPPTPQCPVRRIDPILSALDPDRDRPSTSWLDQASACDSSRRRSSPTIDMSFKRGTITALIGPTGSGNPRTSARSTG